MFRCFTIFVALAIALMGSACKKRQAPIDSEFAVEGGEVVKISAIDDPTSLDPRKVRELLPVSILHWLYDGLMRLNFHGKPQNGIAEDVQISDDGKTYTFKLRPSSWSDGTPLTAGHFVNTWKTILDPSFPAPNAYQLYVIKGAKAAKEGKIPLDEVKLHAPDDHTLIVELEAPTAYFLELVATHFYYPVHPDSTDERPITNGPFMLKKWKRHNELSFAKNPRYWDSREVRLDGILLYILDEHTALRMFSLGELDWVGSPMGTIPQDAIPTLKHQHHLHIAPAAGTHWFRFNVESAPFKAEKMRRAFALAINRKDIVEHVTQGNQTPAEGIVPPSFGLKSSDYFDDHDVPKAWYAFQEALEEMKMSKDELPPISLCYVGNDRNNKVVQAVQQQWKKGLGIEIQLDNCEMQVFLDRLAQKNYQIALGGWYADIRDPINFLEVFKYKNTSTNNTGWENREYIQLLNRSDAEQDNTKRLALLGEAQGILMAEMPVAPLFYGAFNYVKADSLLGAYFSDLGFVDFKHAFFGD